MWIRAVSSLLVLAAACGDDDNGAAPIEPLPVAPQLFASTAFAVFPVTPAGDTSSINVLFTNGGQNDLVFSDLRVEPAGGPFTMIEPASRTASSLGGVSVTLEYAPSARGMSLATFVVRSNAENFPEADMEIIGPASASPRPEAPDLLPYEDTAEAVELPNGGRAAFVRYINVGARSLTVTGYELTGDPEFSFAGGLRMPSVESPVVLGSGSFVILQVNYVPTAAGTHDAVVHITSDDPDSSVTDVSLTGSN
jgi:hypothetical protein